MASTRISGSLRALVQKSSKCPRLISAKGRNFHNTTFQSARPKPRPAPSTRLRQAQVPIPDLNPNGDKSEIDSFLQRCTNLAEEIKAISISSATAFEFLRAFNEHGQNPPVKYIRSLCERFGVSPSNIFALAIIVNREGPGQGQIIARSLLNAAASLGDPSAAIHAMHSNTMDTRAQNPLYYREMQAHLAGFVKEDSNPLGLVAAGNLNEKQGKNDIALKLYERAIVLAQVPENNTMPESSVGLGGTPLLQAYIALARVKNSALKDKEGARAAYEKAAELDSPDAYYHLALLMDNHASDQYRDHLLIAASSGYTQAAYRLGLYYLQLKDSDTSSKTALGKNQDERERLALEWFDLGAAANDKNSIINVILLCKLRSLHVKSQAWLFKIKSSRHLSQDPVIAEIQRMWEDKNCDLEDFRIFLDQYNKDATKTRPD
ncbi:hypothetical protein L228DRAFT_269096 [Xylona heveae TC161]|uniref:HCP-like protein n=1 Tax=Xylona heveae (strain CBS 132557 / TC161) TaxID=1328760 RepID=A0A165G1F7_XYLHT|nr:hypothetical protein L228DRAFT_269096 [Xylona heveae TC161]KZF21629.1 hypothetical protein L228DRAFT_269096 [Xylona heveae TC161]